MAGKGVKGKVAPGEQGGGGQVGLILEAMKMETEIRAASAGTVADIKIREGDTVVAGDTLLTLG
ncbi:MAG: biotin/lipoyl-binding protein [Pseudomonadales bacterium]|nr:biotin/lipoyl-binding protein [Pseudomonadales bacterium]